MDKRKRTSRRVGRIKPKKKVSNADLIKIGKSRIAQLPFSSEYKFEEEKNTGLAAYEKLMVSTDILRRGSE